MKKRPLASEGHLHLPREVGPKRATAPAAAPPFGAASPTGGARLQVLGPDPFATDGGTLTAVVLDDGLLGGASGGGLRPGDRVVLVRGRAPEFGDLVALPALGAAGRLVLWKAHPEANVLRLTSDRAMRALPPETEVAGVVVAVMRALPDARPQREA